MSRSPRQTQTQMQPAPDAARWMSRAVVVLLPMIVLAIYWPVFSHPFITWDDPLYVTANPYVQRGLTIDNVGWAFTTFHAANWHPLTWLTHMLDCRLFGWNTPHAAGRHHVGNVLLHSVNAMLLFALLGMMTGSRWRSAAVAILFAVHPLRVESVAWVSERKDVLSTLFGLLAIIAYVRWTRRSSSMRYSLVFILMAMSLMAKPMLVTLPGILLLLDVWPLNRINFKSSMHEMMRQVMRVIVEKSPLMMLSIIGSVMTVRAQAEWSAFATLDMVSWSDRLAMAVTGVARYVQFTFWPHNLALLYPQERFPMWQWLPSAALLAMVTLIAALHVRARPWIFVGWMWFLGTLVPVIGIVKVGSQSIADRYTYVPTIGLVIVIVWLASELLERVFGNALSRRIGLVGLTMLTLILGIAAREQTRWWRDSQTLYERAIAVTAPNWIMHNTLGMLLAGEGDFAAASTHLREAYRLYPLEPDVMNNLAVLLLVDPDQSRRSPSQALALALNANETAQAPRVAFIDTLAAAYAAVGRFEDAAITAERAARLALDNGQNDVAAQIAAKIPGYREGKTSERAYVEGLAPPIKSPPTPSPREDG